uniref:Salivary toxin-like peptide n=1 Tax=Nyssomyia intermedia TaxID=182990 RepID=J7HIJ5_9DIPT
MIHTKMIVWCFVIAVFSASYIVVSGFQEDHTLVLAETPKKACKWFWGTCSKKGECCKYLSCNFLGLCGWDLTIAKWIYN